MTTAQYEEIKRRLEKINEQLLSAENVLDDMLEAPDDEDHAAFFHYVQRIKDEADKVLAFSL